MRQTRVVDGRVELWLPLPPPGGWVCGEPDDTRPDGMCGMPVEDVPCTVHHPDATDDYQRTGVPALVDELSQEYAQGEYDQDEIPTEQGFVEWLSVRLARAEYEHPDAGLVMRITAGVRLTDAGRAVLTGRTGLHTVTDGDQTIRNPGPETNGGYNE